MKQKLLMMVCLAALGGLGVVRLYQPADYKKELEDLESFYRVQVKLSHSDENLDFDYIVACNLFEPFLGPAPTPEKPSVLNPEIQPERMYRATKDGSAVMVKSIALCSQTRKGDPELSTDSGWVPKDVLPLVVWFEDAKDLSHGWGYVSEAAYESPLSKLKFGGTKISPATKADWDNWRATAKAEYVQAGDLPGPWGEIGPAHDAALMQRRYWQCYFSVRRKLPEAMQAALTRYARADSSYWWLASRPTEEIKSIWNILDDPQLRKSSADPVWHHYHASPSDDLARVSGMPLRSGKTVGKPPLFPDRFAADYFPILTPGYSGPSPSGADVRRWKEFQFKVLVDDKYNGFAHCGRDYLSFLDPQDRSMTRGKASMFFGDQVVYTVDGIGNGMGLGQGRDTGRQFVFYKVQYVFHAGQGS
ncbi:MAG: hypothetical protein HOP09_03775 [Hyphomicrobium sp.]|nr:hypothetical protein [Hyphomicrobium sp.]